MLQGYVGVLLDNPIILRVGTDVQKQLEECCYFGRHRGIRVRKHMGCCWGVHMELSDEWLSCGTLPGNHGI